ncbi:hypothetical protein KDA_11490 [Dictyobacter alpinus]|uniref:Peptidase C51 domain-containing protein n=2 Tax=Dictyobacter alpinus TaxID=2014873 RepID=A0A402B2S9_9CHLR|nr:hypothetical protein KDA_11490 [Dictyobacter alpinus]
MLIDQDAFPDAAPIMPAPGDAQSPLVPLPLDATMMPTTVQTQNTTKSLREPVFIPSTGKKSTGTLRPPQGRRTVVHVGVALVLIVILFGTLLAVLPTGNGEASGKLAQLFNPSTNSTTSRKNDTALIAAEAATATAVTQDGYDAGNQVYAGVQTAAPANNIPAEDQGSLSRFFYGQCTYWANMRYHQLTGHWVPWLGNAGDWAYQAPAYGWKTSPVPNPNGPSIIVLGPYTQGAGSYGHVAVVETGVSNPYNGVSTSNWNWNGGWATTSWVTFYPGPGVTFVWFPG